MEYLHKFIVYCVKSDVEYVAVEKQKKQANYIKWVVF